MLQDTKVRYDDRLSDDEQCDYSDVLTGAKSTILPVTKQSIKVITKLPNSEQSYKGKVKTHNYINRQNQSTTGKL